MKEEIEKKLDAFLVDEPTFKAKSATLSLKEHLRGTILLKLLDSDKHFFYDWRDENFIVSVIPQGEVTYCEPDSIISLTRKNLIEILDGEISPQLLMLTPNITITGKIEMAVYFFNLLYKDNG